MTEITIVERRKKPRPPDGEWTMLDLHHALERRHNDLDSKVSVLATSVMQLADSAHDQHNAVLAGIAGITRWAENHEQIERKDQILSAVFHAALFTCILIILVKIW